MAHTVTSPLVLVIDPAGATQYFYRGATLPAYVPAERIKQLRDDGLIDGPEELAQPNPPADVTLAVTAVEQPAGNASRADWVAFAAAKGASAEETAEVADGGLARDELRDKYGE